MFELSKKVSSDIIEQVIDEFEMMNQLCISSCKKKYGKYNIDDSKIQRKLYLSYHKVFIHNNKRCPGANEKKDKSG